MEGIRWWFIFLGCLLGVLLFVGCRFLDCLLQVFVEMLYVLLVVYCGCFDHLIRMCWLFIVDVLVVYCGCV